MKTYLIVALLSLGAVACREEKAEGRGSASESQSGLETAASAAAVTAKPAAVSTANGAKMLDCDQLVPPALQTKLGLTKDRYKAPHPSTVAGADCSYMKGKSPTSIGVSCPTWDENTMRKSMEVSREGAKKKKDYRELSGVGRMAFISSPTARMTLEQVWDDDTNCFATAVAPDAATVEEMARVTIANVTPAAIGK
jgi:hypothetical protein